MSTPHRRCLGICRARYTTGHVDHVSAQSHQVRGFADRSRGAVSVVVICIGRVHRPNQPMHTSTLSNSGKTSGSPRCSETATVLTRTFQTGVAEGCRCALRPDGRDP